MAFARVLVVLAIAGLAYFLSDRVRPLSTLYANAPHRLVRLDDLGGPHTVRFQDQIRSCEDVVLLNKDGLILAACDEGREMWNTVMGVFQPGEVPNASLYVFDYKDASAPDSEALKRLELVDFPSAADFHTLGMAYDDATSTLFVANHARAGPRIEVFRVDLTALTATWLRTIQHSLIHGPNSIALVSDREFYVTNDHYFPATRSKLLSTIETYLALPLGTVVHVNLGPEGNARGESEVQASVVARVAFANGIEILNSTTVAVAATSAAAVHFYTVAPADASQGRHHPSLTWASQLKLHFLPDNLSLSHSSGGSGSKLLIAGHPHAPSTARFTHTRHICNRLSPAELASDERVDAATREYCAHGQAPSWVAEWSEDGGLRDLYVGTDYPTACTAVRDDTRGVGVVSGLYAKGLFVWRV